MLKFSQNVSQFETPPIDIVQRENVLFFYAVFFFFSFCQSQNRHVVAEVAIFAKESAGFMICRCRGGRGFTHHLSVWRSYEVPFEYLPIPDWLYVSGIYIRCYLL